MLPNERRKANTKIEQTQLLKRMLRVRRQTSSLAVYGDLGQFLKIVLQKIFIDCFNRLVSYYISTR